MADKELLEYFIEDTRNRFDAGERRFDKIDERFDAQDQKLDSLLAFKWQVFGGALVISAMITVAIQIVFGSK